MKKITLSVVAISFLSIAIYGGLRYQKNKVQVKPYPYTFKDDPILNYDQNSPILIIGDRQGERLASFSKFMAKQMSLNLSKLIKVATLATKGEGIHRTIHKIKNLPKLPLIIVYLGGNQEFYESVFNTEDIDKITENFKLYSDDTVKTLIMIFPFLSRLIYDPINYKVLGPELQEDTNKYTDITIQKRNIISYSLYKEQLEELFNYTKDHGSYLIAVTQPINLDAPPRKSCAGSFPKSLASKYKDAVQFIKNNDYKSAYNITKNLVLIAPNNAKVLYIHGKVSKSLGNINEAIKYLKLSSAYDCQLWRGNIVYNSILKKVAKDNEISIFDFQKMLESNWNRNITYMDDIYPQNIYFEKLSLALASRIKKLLKL